MHQYHAFGLRIASELRLPELHPGRGPADLQILIRRGAVELNDDDWLRVQTDEVKLLLGGAQFTISGGRSIEITAPEGMPGPDIRLWLLGSVMAALLHQRGYFPLHANVVELPGRPSAAAFSADSGGGKSTLAAWFDRRGYPVLTDDLCAIRTDGPVAPAVFEGIPRMKLWAQTLEAFSLQPARYEKVSSELDKFHVPLSGATREGRLEPLRLERLYVLDKAEGDSGFEVTRLSGAEGAVAVLANAFRWELGQLINREARAQFDQCLALAQNAAVFRVRRSWSMDRFDAEAREIERHLLTPLDEL